MKICRLCEKHATFLERNLLCSHVVITPLYSHCIHHHPSAATGDNLEAAAAEADDRGRRRPQVHVPAQGPRGPAAGRARHAVLQPRQLAPPRRSGDVQASSVGSIPPNFGIAKRDSSKGIDSFTLWGIPSFMMFCRAFLTCSTGRWADTAATVQPNW